MVFIIADADFLYLLLLYCGRSSSVAVLVLWCYPWHHPNEMTAVLPPLYYYYYVTLFGSRRTYILYPTYNNVLRPRLTRGFALTSKSTATPRLLARNQN